MSLETPKALVLTRHGVGLGVVLGVLNWQVYTSNTLREAAIAWVGTLLGVVLISLVLNALWLLFFTERARRHFVDNNVRTAWVLAGLVLFGMWKPVWSTWQSSTQTPSDASARQGDRGALHDSVQTALSSAAVYAAPPVPEFENMESRLSYLRWLAGNQARFPTALMNADEQRQFLQTLWYESRRAGLPPNLVLGLVQTSSAFDRVHVSGTGARGYMSVSPRWSQVIGDGDVEKLFHTQTNLRFGCVLLRHFMDLNSGDIRRALVAYREANASGTADDHVRFADDVLTKSGYWLGTERS